PDPCSPLPGSAFRGLENRLYRVEIHSGGNVGQATWKWSRDNGAVTFGIREFRPNEPNRVELMRMGRDAMLSIKNGDWAEVLGDASDLHGNGGTIAQIDLADAPTRLVTFNGAVDAHDTEMHPIVRRWDGQPQTTSADAVELEDGIHVRFSGSGFRPGDYWTFTARTAEEGGLELLQDAPPQGIRHHYAKLAFVDWVQSNNGWTPTVFDCRDLFPPLNDIDAKDVGFQSDVCEFDPDVKTVQDALEALCSQDHECCTLLAQPGAGWESVFDQIPEGGDAAICFKAGLYPVDGAPVVVANRGHLKLTGIGPGTRIVAQSGECAVRFENCKSVTVRDLNATAEMAGTLGNAKHLNGALTFRHCNKVSLHSLDVQCANSTRRRAACITIRNDQPLGDGQGIVEVENCDLHIGDEQVGLLLVNAFSASIRNNRLSVRRPAQRGYQLKVEDKSARAGMIDALVSGVSYRAIMIDKKVQRRDKKSREREKNVRITIGDKELGFSAEPALAGEWVRLLAANPPAEADEKSMTRSMRKLATDYLLGNTKTNGALQDFVNGLQTEEVSSASQGITIGGTDAEEITITGNTLTGVSQGIHVGVSHHDPNRSMPDRGGRVVITGNHLHVHAVLGATRSRHAIFVGNADSIVVRDNYAKLTRYAGTSGLPIDGIRLFGYFGRYINVRENQVEKFGTGVLVQLRGEAPQKKPMWQIHDNFTANATDSVVTNHAWIDAKGNLS
ncbi:MAG TPA: DUF6519 domain-containing protein, partial [Thermoanaerobaculia bacterium]